MSKAHFLFPFTLFLGACTANQVAVEQSDQTVVKYKTSEGYTDRFANLYKQPETYPYTCEEACYPDTPLIQCQGDMEQCQYIGDRPDIVPELGFYVKWLGHASFLLTMPDGQQVLVDPVSEQFDWPIDVGFKLTGGFYRTEPDWPSEPELDQLSAVVYSHIHYDHFNKSDIDTLGTGPTYYTPLGFADYFSDGGYKIQEMAWYASAQNQGLTVHFVPAHHFSSRIIVPYITEDNDATLWGGWLFEFEGKTLFYAGDTGYSQHFRDIQQRYGNIDVCLLPIASYHHDEYAKWYRNVHLTPEDMLAAANDLNCKQVVPWGYGNMSWKMGDLTSHSALFRLLHVKQAIAPQQPLYILNEGESVHF
ncbi:Zn-dependent hydrolase [Pseudoalteromonas rubra]|uniref:Zn-dependent hydrolase n=1 Tax=Pseudoalteromonas rubra TaxID=43658 RepID=A0A5S3WUE3_9GAMM|nr:MBL fold metallo-hydrolase [Pseudoalteromonas rubra]TMP31846.1 Zn-dependent hydrolase [Pseudoalteromonas rubra]TMP33253.1 Zn-dependent hydrolase [Pseudoalteromonas rubra]